MDPSGLSVLLVLMKLFLKVFFEPEAPAYLV